MHDVRFYERNVMGERPQPHSPWILYFDGATRENGTHNPVGIGAVLKNSRGHTVVELKKLVSPGVSSTVAKYKSLIAGLKKALSLGVEYLLAKGDSRLVHNQVVGHCSVQDERLVEYQRKVLTLSKDFRALFMERIPREDNMRADQLANDAIDEELQVVDRLSEFIDQEWTSQEKHASQQHSVHSRPHSHSHAVLPPPPVHHLKVKPALSASPHVMKHHIDITNLASAATKSDADPSSGTRSRTFCSNDDDSSLRVEQMGPPVRKHVQAAAKSRRRSRTRLRLSSMISPSKRPVEILVPHWDQHHRNHHCNNSSLAPRFSNDSSGSTSDQEEEGEEGSDKEEEANTSTVVGECHKVLDNSACGSGSGSGSGGGGATAGEQGAAAADEECVAANYLAQHIKSSSSSCSEEEDESESDVDFSEQDYARLVKTLLKGFLQRKRALRS